MLASFSSLLYFKLLVNKVKIKKESLTFFSCILHHVPLPRGAAYFHPLNNGGCNIPPGNPPGKSAPPLVKRIYGMGQ